MHLSQMYCIIKLLLLLSLAIGLEISDSSLPTCIKLEHCLFAYRGRNVIQHYACCLMLWVFRYFKELLSSPNLLTLLPC